jgi:2-polyprenyl-3-methyl-5-hydroxy-6-metoxy-1,4-benzoquinol methylase
MSEILEHCPLCNATTSKPFDTRQFRDREVQNRICGNCGLVYQSPRMTAAELEEFYASEYRQVYQGKAGPTQKDLFVQNGRADVLLDFLSHFDIQPERYLDIGSSSGIMLKRFQENLDCQVVGVEPGDAYREYAKEQGLNVYADIEDLTNAGEDGFDLVSMAHVLEHIPDPVSYLANLRQETLTPWGWLLIEVPNLYSHESFEIAHMTSFSGHSLRQVLKKAGYQVMALKKHGQPRSDMLPLYLTALAKPGGDDFMLVPERNVALKRGLGMVWRRILLKVMPGRAWKSVKSAKDE